MQRKILRILKNKVVIAILIGLLALPFLFRLSVPILNRILGAPSLDILENYQPIGSIEVYDYKDKLAGVLQGEEDRQVIQLDQVSDLAKKSILAAEDSQFFKHSGFSLTSLVRAVITNIKAGRVVQGGSTLTQQMVKNLFIREDERYQRTLRRKVIELLIALEVESKYSKERILEIYLNQVYFGNLAYGIERAAQRYFSKHASKLDLLESTYLAGLLTAPSHLSKNLKEAQVRQQYVLDRMLELGYITKEEYAKADIHKMQFRKSQGNLAQYPYYFSYVEQELNKRFTRNQLKTMGLKVYTGLDPKAEMAAAEIMETGIKNAASGINQAALVTIDVETAQVRALVGGVGNFWQNQYNRATNVHTIGSAFKPFVYLTAFMNGVIDQNTIIKDEPIVFDDASTESMVWSPQNFDLEFHGPTTARAALIFSRNIPAIKVAMQAGLNNVIDTAHKAGIKSDMQPNLSLALGSGAFTPLEVATAYSTFARGGVRVEPILIRKILDNKGNVIEKNDPVAVDALPQRHVSLLVEILKDVVNYGTGALAKIEGRIVAGKTGTADGSRDIWFTGFTPDTVTVVWAGNERNREVLSSYATGGSTPAWIWREFMLKYYENNPRAAVDFKFNNNYVSAKIDPLTGLLATEYTPNPVEMRFTPGTEPKRYAPVPDTSDIKSRSDEAEDENFTNINDRKMSEEDEKIQMLKKINESEKAKKPETKRNVPEPKTKPNATFSEYQ